MSTPLALKVLSLAADHDRIGIGDVVREFGVARSSAYRALSALEASGHLLLSVGTVRSLAQLLPFFSVLSQVFNSKVTSRCAGHSGSPVLYSNTFPGKDTKLENHKPFSSKARQKIEEMVEKDFLEGVIKT